jgi:hypothetical protein
MAYGSAGEDSRRSLVARAELGFCRKLFCMRNIYTPCAGRLFGGHGKEIWHARLYNNHWSAYLDRSRSIKAKCHVVVGRRLKSNMNNCVRENNFAAFVWLLHPQSAF